MGLPESIGLLLLVFRRGLELLRGPCHVVQLLVEILHLSLCELSFLDNLLEEDISISVSKNTVRPLFSLILTGFKDI